MTQLRTGTPVDMVSEHLGDELNERRSPDGIGALMAVAGAAIGIGLMAVGFDEAITDGGRTMVLVVSAVLVALGYGALLAWKGEDRLIQPMSVVLIVIGIVGLAFFIPPVDNESLPLRAIMLAVFALGAWFAVPTRGRPALLGVALAAIWALLIDVGGDANVPDGFTGDYSNSGLISVLFGVALLWVLFALDKRGMHGALATPFAAIGNLAFLFGVLAVLSGFGSTAGVAVVVLIAGLWLVFVGSHGSHRRVTTWLGSVGVFSGLAGLVGALLDNGSARATGLLLALFGAMLGFAALFLSDPARRASFTNNAGTAGAAGAVDSAATPAPGWYPDPTGRHTTRYWDGTTWTANVRTDDTDAIDPV